MTTRKVCLSKIAVVSSYTGIHLGESGQSPARIVYLALTPVYVCYRSYRHYTGRVRRAPGCETQQAPIPNCKHKTLRTKRTLAFFRPPEGLGNDAGANLL